MQNGSYILNDMKFDEHIKAMGDRELSEFTARLAYSSSIRVSSLESKNKKFMAASGGAGAVITATIIGIIEYFRRGG